MRVRWNEYMDLIMRKCVFGYARIRARWIGPLRLAECTWCISWANVNFPRNVRNVFILCMLHIHRTKVWFLPCKSMVFGVQKVGFCIAKVWFLFFECYVVVNWSHAFRSWMWISHRIFATLFQFVSSVISSPQAAVGADLSCPHICMHPCNRGRKCVYN